MASKTRQKILDTALELFNQHGLDGVSIGDIARELNISKGNVTYYFPRKQDILDALMPSLTWGDSLLNQTTLEELVDLLIYAQEVARKHAFFFRHYTQISQLSPNIKAKQRLHHQTLTSSVSFTLEKLEEAGMVQPARHPGSRLRVAETLFLTCAYWTPFSELREDDGLNVASQCIGLLRLILTEKGEEELQRIVTQKYPELISSIA